MEQAEFRNLIREAGERLKASGVDSPAAEVEIILEYLLEIERLEVYLNGAILMDKMMTDQFNKIIEKRSTRYPLQYILGETYFYGRRFLIDPDVMVPTPETELLCELSSNHVKNENIEAPQILDLGTGSGVIAVTLGCELPSAWITAVDISQAALAVARKNAALHGTSGRIRFMKSDLFGVLETDEKFDLILCNPPYIAESEYRDLPPEVQADPMISLVSGVEGLDMIKRLIDQAPDYLSDGGRLMFEVGYNHSDKVAAISEADRRYRSFSIIKDLNDIDRVIILSI
jgi:release factor glutamine methyltransferase